MRYFYVNEPEICLFVWNSTLSSDIYAILYDKSSISSASLRSETHKIHGFLEQEDLGTHDLEIFPLHIWNSEFSRSLLSLEPNDLPQLIINETGFDSAQHLLIQDRPEHKVIQDGEIQATYRFRAGTFPLERNYPTQISEFNEMLNLDAMSMMGDWQEVLVAEDKFNRVYSSMMTLLSGLKIDRTKNSYWV